MTLLFCVCTGLFLAAGCQKYGLVPAQDPRATTIREPERIFTQTEYFQLETSTATFVPFPYSTPFPTETPVPPMPTHSLPPITPATPNPLEGIYLRDEIIYYEGFVEDGSINLRDYHFEHPFEIEARSYALSGWSVDRKYQAEKRTLPPIRNFSIKYRDIGICISNVEQRERYLTENVEVYNKCIRLYTNIYDHLSVTHGNYAEIKNISWSPDNMYLLATVKGVNTSQYIITSPCLVEVETNSVDCHWANIFKPYFNPYYDDAYKVVTGAHAISWSPQNENKLAIPLKRNWCSITNGVKNGVEYCLSPLPWDSSTDDLLQGLYITDLTPLVSALEHAENQILTLLWQVPPNTTIDPDQLPLWTSDGKRIAFVYVDPWFNVEKSTTAMRPIANYAVGLVEEENGNFIKLFDSSEMYLSGVLPSDSSLPIILIHRWIDQDRFLLFTAKINREETGEYEHSLFLYDTETQLFFQLTNWSRVE